MAAVLVMSHGKVWDRFLKTDPARFADRLNEEITSYASFEQSTVIGYRKQDPLGRSTTKTGSQN